MENRITVDVYVEKKLSAEIAELKVQLARMEFQTLVLKEENEALLVEGSEGNIFDLCKEMADFWMSKGECKSDELDDYFTLVK